MDTIGVAGNATSLHCNVSGNPISSVQWYKNGLPILSGPEQLPNPDNIEFKREASQESYVTSIFGFSYWFSILTILELNVTDTGTYQCIAEQQEVLFPSTQANLLVLCK